MTESTEPVGEGLGRVPESLKTLADYLEQSLDNAVSILMLRNDDGRCTIYLGDTSAPRDELRKVATIDVTLANEMLELTHSGENQVAISDKNIASSEVSRQSVLQQPSCFLQTNQRFFLPRNRYTWKA